MFLFYGMLFLGFIGLFFVTKSYKKEEIAFLSKKEHRLKYLYSLVMYLEDRMLGKLSVFHSNKVDNSLKNLLVKEKIQKERYLYEIKKKATSFVVIIFFIIIGFFMSITACCKKNQTINELQRPKTGEGYTQVQLKVRKEGGAEEEVDLKIEEKKLSENEIRKIFKENHKKILQTVFAENSSLENVNKKLNLIHKFENIDIFWKLDEEGRIDYSGSLNLENITDSGEKVDITAVLALNEVEEEYKISFRLIPGEDQNILGTNEKIQSSIDQNNSVYNEKITLPEELEEKKIYFFPLEEKGGIKFFVGGVIFGIVFYIMSDKGLERKDKKRKEQMITDYSDIVSKITLLTKAGLTIYGAWERILRDYDEKAGEKRYAFEEMKYTFQQIRGGVPQREAFRAFGKRCNIPCYLKFSSLMEQSVQKGTKEFESLMNLEIREAFEIRKNIAKIKGEEAGTKLLVPMILMLGIVITIIVVPAFQSMSF